ncbi:chromatin assembly factor 1 subunit A-like [Scyliorhinus canicula]|uniref:chromatin assembly factor 1 subunit A-like n=1 Tax=Scyliorhinus canicula TaxID=7830 RepID=UPI0018F32BA5|nr:chromatin assembly factor 1 subunit A-like [Scyliorhinus canicula]XP_038631564.1 chromatin assembly factor 1 subunit A-like [Scyliorhinus canicula]
MGLQEKQSGISASASHQTWTNSHQVTLVASFCWLQETCQLKRSKESLRAMREQSVLLQRKERKRKNERDKKKQGNEKVKKARRRKRNTSIPENVAEKDNIIDQSAEQ